MTPITAARSQTRRASIAALRDASACASAPSRRCHMARRGACCSRAHGRASRVLALLDEPFAGLDRATRADLARRLNDWLEEGGSCVIATHHRDEWPAHTTHVLELAGGRVVPSQRHMKALVDAMSRSLAIILTALALALAWRVRRSLRRPEALRLAKPRNHRGDTGAGPAAAAVSLAEAGMDPQAVEAAVRYAATRNTRALVVGARRSHRVREILGRHLRPTPRWLSGLRAGAGGIAVGTALNERLITISMRRSSTTCRRAAEPRARSHCASCSRHSSDPGGRCRSRR